MSMSTGDNPPVVRGPFVTPWPANARGLPALPNRARALPTMPVQASGGVALPSDTTPTVELARLAVANGSKVFDVSSAASTPILTRPPNIRNFLYLRNASATANIYVDFGGDASALSAIRLEPNEQLLLDAVVLQDDMNAFADAANGVLSVMFSNVALPPGFALP